MSAQEITQQNLLPASIQLLWLFKKGDLSSKVFLIMSGVAKSLIKFLVCLNWNKIVGKESLFAAQLLVLADQYMYLYYELKI